MGELQIRIVNRRGPDAVDDGALMGSILAEIRAKLIEAERVTAADGRLALAGGNVALANFLPIPGSDKASIDTAPTSGTERLRPHQPGPVDRVPAVMPSREDLRDHAATIAANTEALRETLVSHEERAAFNARIAALEAEITRLRRVAEEPGESWKLGGSDPDDL